MEPSNRKEMIKSGEGSTVWSRRRMWPVGKQETVIQSVSLRENGQWSMIHVLRSRYMTEMEN